MRIVRAVRRRSFILVITLATLLTFVLGACGANSNPTSSGAGSASTPTATATSAGGGTVTSCPNSAVVTTAPASANVTLKPSNSNSTVTAKKGDVIEVDLPFGQAWSGPTTSQGVLQLQNPAGYAWDATKVCVWRFVAQDTGTSQLNFVGHPICKKGQLCPQYVMAVPFTVEVK